MIRCYMQEGRNYKEIEFKPFKYPAGEVGYKIDIPPGDYPSEYRKLDYIYCWFEGSDDILLLKMLIEQFPDADLFFPYLPFSREDRRVDNNSSYGLKMLSSVLGKNRIETFDIHSHHFGVINHQPIMEISKTILDCKPDGIIAPDEGAKLRYSLPTVGCGDKVRNQSTGEVIDYKFSFSEHVDPGAKLLVVDDICDGGRTFIELAKCLPDYELYLYVSHGIFSKGFDELKKYYKHIYTTDSFKGERDNEFVTEYRCLQGLTRRSVPTRDN